MGVATDPGPPSQMPQKMSARERRARILGMLEEQLSVRTSSVARQLGVTEATIRSDLERLSRGGLLERSHGGALALRIRRIYAGRSAAAPHDDGARSR